MYPILEKRLLAEGIWLMQVLAPRVAHSARPGQFIIVRADEHGERIPLTISDFDPEERHHRNAGHRRFDAQNLFARSGRSVRRLRRPARPPLGIRRNAARRAPQAALPLRRRRRRHRPGLSSGQMAQGARRQGRRDHRRQDPRHAHLHRRDARRGRKPLHRHRRRLRKASRGSLRR